MNKKLIPLLSLFAAGMLVACDNTSTPAPTPSSEESTAVSSSQEVVSSSETPSETSSVEESSSEVPQFVVSESSDTKRVMPEYEENNGVYTFYLSANKSAVVLSGVLEGNIIISDARIKPSEEIGNMALELNGVTITSATACPIYYAADSKKVVLDVKKETENVISYTGADEMAAVESENNIEISGKGTVTFSSESGHAVKSDELLLSSSTKINVSKSGKDGFHVKELIMSEDKEFSGKITMENIGKQALDVADYDKDLQTADGSIIWSQEGAEIVVKGATNVFNLDNSTTIPVTTKITATNVTGDFAVKENKNLTISITVADGAEVACNGKALTGTINL